MSAGRPRATKAGGGFDRLRPRSADPAPVVAVSLGVDADGKRALFSRSRVETTPLAGSISIECSRCGAVSRVGPRQALLALAPSFHVFPFHRAHPSYLRCPACTRASWVRVRVGA